jgi:hypothetical protein
MGSTRGELHDRAQALTLLTRINANLERIADAADRAFPPAGPPRDRSLEGKRVQLVARSDLARARGLVPGQKGTVRFVDVLGTVHVIWDDGHTLGLIAEDGDQWEVLEP